MRDSSDDEKPQVKERKAEEESEIEVTADPGPPPEPAEPKVPKRTRRSAKVRHIGRGRLVVVGPSGSRYAFQGHGATLKVKGEDVETLLAIERRPRGCCGGAGQRVIRPLVKV